MCDTRNDVEIVANKIGPEIDKNQKLDILKSLHI